MRALALVLMLLSAPVSTTSCAGLPQHVGEHPQRLHWPHEPTVCTDVPVWEDYIKDAISDWTIGRYVGDACEHADIRYRQGYLTAENGGAWGEAHWPGESNPCDISIAVSDRRVVSHELGHCLGLDHSWDRRSIMYPTIPSYTPAEAPGGFFQFVTREDRALARCLVLRECEN